MTIIDPKYGLGLEQGVNRLVEHNSLWSEAFDAEAARIGNAIGSLAIAIEHYGSTSVPNLRAKPIIDLLIGVSDIGDGTRMIEPMARLGYDYAGSQGIPHHHIFGLGVARTHLAHVVVHMGDQWLGSLRFRDRLKASSGLRDQYQELKARLAAETTNRAEYNDGKTAFISRYSDL